MFYQLQSPMEIILLLIGSAIFAVIAYRRPVWGVALILFLAPIYLFKIKIGWLPLNALEILIGALAIVWAAKSISGLKITKDRLILLAKSFYFWPILLILIGVALSVIFSTDLKIGAGIFKSYFLAPLIFAVILFNIIKNKEQLAKIVWTLVLSGATAAVVGLIYRLAGQLTFDDRLAAFYSSPNQLAMFLAPGFILAVSLWFFTQKKQQKWLLAISYLLYALCLYFTCSYAAWLAISGAVIFLVVFFWREGLINNKKLLIILCSLAAIFIVFLILQRPSQKMADLLSFERSSIQSRLMVWSAAREILKDNWLLGIGPGMFQEQYLVYQNHFNVSYLEWAVPQPHNLWLAWWLQAGIIGLIGFIWLTVNFLRRLFYSLAIKQPLALALMAVIAYILLHGLADTTFWRNDLALVFWSIIALGNKAGRLFYSQKISNPL